MTITNNRENDKLIISLDGRLDTVTAPQLEDELGKCLAGVSELVFDFGKLDYISSAGLRVLLRAQKVMNRQGSMEVHNVNDTIREIFEVTGFCDILTVI